MWHVPYDFYFSHAAGIKFKNALQYFSNSLYISSLFCAVVATNIFYIFSIFIELFFSLQICINLNAAILKQCFQNNEIYLKCAFFFNSWWLDEKCRYIYIRQTFWSYCEVLKERSCFYSAQKLDWNVPWVLSKGSQCCMQMKYVLSASPLYYLHKLAYQLGTCGSNSMWTQGHSAMWANI